jgi:cytochrome c biogenesis protein CcmG/thiol:disulfide interchange protein DsbE
VPPRGGPPIRILGLGVVVVAVAAFAAIALTQPGSPATSSAAPGSLAPVGSASQTAAAALPAYVADAADPAVGRPIPELVGASFDGSPVNIKADGRPKLILFIAHWCPHCQREVPVVQAWLDAKRLPAGVDLISVATAIDPNRPNYPPDTWLAGEHWQPPVIVDGDGRIATLYGLNAFPYWVAVNADGTVASRQTGELTPAQLDAIVASLGATASPGPS